MIRSRSWMKQYPEEGCHAIFVEQHRQLRVRPQVAHVLAMPKRIPEHLDGVVGGAAARLDLKVRIRV